MLGSQLVIQALARRGVRTIFSLSGNQIMPLYDACIDAGIRIVHVRHEAAAVFMADAWSQVTGEIGVALLTAGPGITNGVAPLYSAAQAESPVLLLSGDSPLGEDGMGAFQEMDQAAIPRP
jgi:acetolactate synthase-1/2/3 large subunit